VAVQAVERRCGGHFGGQDLYLGCVIPCLDAPHLEPVGRRVRTSEPTEGRSDASDLSAVVGAWDGYQ